MFYIVYIMTEMYCKICNITFSKKQAYNNHYTTKSHIKKATNETKTYSCHCGKVYLHRQSLHKHSQMCTFTPLKSNVKHILHNETDQTEVIQKLQEKNKALQEENTQLKRQLKGIKRVTPSMRQMVANNQERKCGQCSNDLQTYFQVDHIIGKQFGGDNSLENLMALCGECHNQKSALENIKREQIKQAIQNILQEPTPMSLSV
jgi:5-methylcytosine-specific restriction endonuclease McrA